MSLLAIARLSITSLTDCEKWSQQLNMVTAGRLGSIRVEAARAGIAYPTMLNLPILQMSGSFYVSGYVRIKLSPGAYNTPWFTLLFTLYEPEYKYQVLSLHTKMLYKAIFVNTIY